MPDLSRRTVLTAAAATCGTGLLGGCGGGSRKAAGPAPASPAGAAPGGGGGLRVTLAQLGDIPVGGAITADAPDGTTVLLTQPEPGEVVAFSAVCPHEGCKAAPDGDRFTCPCHGSQFALDGSLQRGPAPRGLSSYAVQVVDGQVLPA